MGPEYTSNDLRQRLFVPAEYYGGKVDRVVVMNVVIKGYGRNLRFLMARGRDGMYRTPGGSLEGSEYYSETGVREIFEETGRVPKPEALRLYSQGIVSRVRDEIYHIVTYYGNHVEYFGYRRPRRQQPERLEPWRYFTMHQAEGFVERDMLYPAFFTEIKGALDRYQIIRDDARRISIPKVSAPEGSFLWYIHRRDSNPNQQ